MKTNTIRLFAVSALLLAGDVCASAQTAMTTESVTVMGSRRAYHDFSQTFATPTITTGKIARWEHKICPLVTGQTANYDRFIAQRVQYVALAAGAPVNMDPACRPNIEIIFTTTPQDLLDSVAANDQHVLGYFSSIAEKKALATVTRPIQAWYTIESVDLKGRRRLETGRSIAGGTTVGNFQAVASDNGDVFTPQTGSALTDIPPFFATTGNRLSDGIRTGFTHVLIVVDSTKLAGQDVVPLADYISMLALSQINLKKGCQELPSIVNRMAPDCGHAADSLTMYDLAYLQGLYRMSAIRSAAVQRSEIGDMMTDRLEKISSR